MGRIIRLTESDLARIVKRVISEQDEYGDLAKTPGQLRRDIRQDARQDIRNINQSARDVRQAERQANQDQRQADRQANQDQRQKERMENQAKREIARTQRQAERLANKQERVNKRNMAEMRDTLADLENMVKLYRTSETFKPLLLKYTAAIEALKKGLMSPEQ
jgi:DNA repair exonuclease SbcCD ATPase subunit